MSNADSIAVTVRFRVGTYFARAEGKTASCTISPSHAVKRLAEGGTIQANRSTMPETFPFWVDLDENDGEVLFTCAPELYRAKPEESR